jgi:two-component system, cell cycle response regulator DivK
MSAARARVRATSYDGQIECAETAHSSVETGRACALFSRTTNIGQMPEGHAGRSIAAPSPLILIVEDDVETRQFYLQALSTGGFRTDQAHNGLQAFEKAVQDLPDLVLTDIAVPGIDGIELCRRLRADGRTRGIPLLAITGYGDREYERRARGAGADHVLIKPCSADTLTAEAHRLLARPALHAGEHRRHKIV